jgi:hypothetical protein
MMEFEPHYCDVIVKRWEDFYRSKSTTAFWSYKMSQGIEHKPTEESRRLVKSLSAVGIRYVDIAQKLDITSDTYESTIRTN